MKKLAYLILAHTDEINLKRLIDSLNYNSDFYIHIDKKADIKRFDSLNKYKNIYFVKREKVNWAGFNMIKATKSLIIRALDNNGLEKYSHLILLSGMDYPIKSNEYIHEYFTSNPKCQFIRAFNINESDDNCIKQVNRYWFYDISIPYAVNLGKIIRKIVNISVGFIKRPINIKIKNKELLPCFGSQWWALTPECCKYIIDFTSINPEIDSYFRYTFSPDEKYFHTIIFNSKYDKFTTNKGLERFIKGGICLMENCHIIDESLSKYYTSKDFEYIKKSDKLFVRKVNTVNSSELLDLIDTIR